MLGCDVLDTPNGATLYVDEWQATSVSNVYAAGECTGVGGVELSALEGRIAAYAALACFARRDRYRRFAWRMHDAFALNPALRTFAAPGTILC